LHLKSEPVGLEPVVGASIDSVRLAADSKNIDIDTIIEPAAGRVLGDRERLQQVLWNLLSNATKFTPAGGKIRVEVERKGEMAEIRVADTGQGIDRAFLPHVFERFRQADASSTRSVGGLGLGLAIVKHLVEAHGGTVRAESEGKGRGSTFIVRLPLLAERESSLAPRGDLGWTGGPFECPKLLTGIKVLVVDDEEDTREMLAVVLKECEAEVRSAGSAAQALEILEQWIPDVTVSDIGMPHEDGYSLIKKIRERPVALGGGVPAVALTAYARFEDRMRALTTGFQMHVAKPIEPAELVMVIHSLLEFKGNVAAE
jgi:CheY-like chemotaxis protein